jgi:hypothetical protein
VDNNEPKGTEPRQPERIVVRSRRRDPGSRIVFGVILISLGVFTLLQQLTHVSFSFVPLVIGIAFLAGWSRNSNYGFLLAGGILSGLGTGSLVGSFVPGQYYGVLTLVGLSSGFALTGALSKRRGWHWEFIVAAGLLFSALFSNSWIELSPDLTRIVLPLSVIAIGLLLIFRSSLPRGVWRVAISLSLVAALLMLSANGFDFFPNIENFGSNRVEFTRTVDVPPLAVGVDAPPFSERFLHLTSGAMSVEITHSDVDAIRVSIKASGRGLAEAKRIALAQSATVSQTGTGVNVVLARKRVLVGESVSASISIPDSMEVSLVTNTGDVSVDHVKFSRLTVRTSSGDIAFSGTARSVVLITASGDVASQVDGSYSDVYIRTASGDVALSLGQDPEMQVTSSSGDIVVRGFGIVANFERKFHRDGIEGTLEVATASGDVAINGTRAPSPSPGGSVPPTPEPTSTVTATSV